jgi:hypothetical protein
MLTRRLLDRLAEIIRRRVEEFHRRLFGTTFAGGDVPTASGEDPLPASIIHLSFALGKAEAVLKEEEWEQVTWDQLKASTQVELSETERRQIEAAELSAYTEFRGLADDIQDGLYRKLSQATGKVVTEAQVRGTIADKVQLGVEVNSSCQTVAKELVSDLKEQKRNWVRVASTEMHSARQRGVAQTIRAGEGVYKDADGDNSRVAVVPAGDACDDCIRLYTDGGTPKIFRLSELMANEGTNYIRPWRQNARPVVPPLHPHCFCRLQYVPDGFGWDDKGRFTMIEKSDSMHKAIDHQPHSLLNSAMESLPSKDYINQIQDPKELERLIPRLERLQQMYSHNFEVYQRVDDLIHAAYGHYVFMTMHDPSLLEEEEGANA